MKAFTLVELMVVMLIFLIIAATAFGVLVTGRRTLQAGTAIVEAQQEARKAMDSMVRELRGASSVDPSTFIAGASDDFIRFTSEGQVIEFAVNARQLQRTAAGVTSVLANDIEDIQFWLFVGDVVHITITVQKRSTLGHLVEDVLNSQIILRN